MLISESHNNFKIEQTGKSQTADKYLQVLFLLCIGAILLNNFIFKSMGWKWIHRNNNVYITINNGQFKKQVVYVLTNFTKKRIGWF